MLSFLHGGEQFVFTARTVSKNHIVAYDNLTLSPLMRERKKEANVLCELMIKPPKNQDTYTFLKEHIEMLAHCFIGKKTRVYDYGEEDLHVSMYQTDTMVLPVYFTVDFKEDFVTLSPLSR